MSDTYETKNLMFCAVCLSEGVPLLDTLVDGDYLTFVLGDYERCSKLEQKWWAGNLVVNATDYSAAIKRLKSLVHSQRY